MEIPLAPIGGLVGAVVAVVSTFLLRRKASKKLNRFDSYFMALTGGAILGVTFSPKGSLRIW